MPANLAGKHVAILATDGVEQVEFTAPRDARVAAGASVSILSIKGDPIQGFRHLDRGDTFPARSSSRRSPRECTQVSTRSS
jgi:protease I